MKDLTLGHSDKGIEFLEDLICSLSLVCVLFDIFGKDLAGQVVFGWTEEGSSADNALNRSDERGAPLAPNDAPLVC